MSGKALIGPTAASVSPSPLKRLRPRRRTAAVSTASILATTSSVGIRRSKHEQLAGQVLADGRAAFERPSAGWP